MLEPKVDLHTVAILKPRDRDVGMTSHQIHLVLIQLIQCCLSVLSVSSVCIYIYITVIQINTSISEE